MKATPLPRAGKEADVMTLSLYFLQDDRIVIYESYRVRELQDILHLIR